MLGFNNLKQPLKMVGIPLLGLESFSNIQICCFLGMGSELVTLFQKLCPLRNVNLSLLMLLNWNVHHQEEKEAAQSIISDMALALKGRPVQVVFFLCNYLSSTFLWFSLCQQ